MIIKSEHTTQIKRLHFKYLFSKMEPKRTFFVLLNISSSKIMGNHNFIHLDLALCYFRFA